MAFVYILKAINVDRYYIGSATNLDARLKHHFGGHTPSTKKFGMLKLVLAQRYPTLREARKIEAKLKKLKRRDYIDKIVQDGRINMRV